MFSHILVPTDGTPASLHALKAGSELARAHKARLTLLHVSPEYATPYVSEGAVFEWPPEEDYRRECTRAAEKIFHRARETAKQAGVELETLHVFGDSPAQAILDEAKRGHADLIVMASHGRRGLEALLLGSETQKVLARAGVPVMVVR